MRTHALRSVWNPKIIWDLDGVVLDAIKVSIRRLFHLSLNLMSALVPCLAGLPIEILERILLHLPGQDIVKMEAVRGIVPDSVRCDLNFVLSRTRSVGCSRT